MTLLESAVKTKPEAHLLHEGRTGRITSLASIGG
jgi:hypothetical protein